MVACYAVLQCFYTDQAIRKENGMTGPPKYAPGSLVKFFEKTKKEIETSSEEVEVDKS